MAHLAALPAFWVGLMYDQGALDAAWDLVKDFDAETREGLRVAASVSALQGEAGGVKLLDLSRRAVALAQAGLRARARAGNGQADEVGYLDVLVESLEAGAAQADQLLALYHGAWGGRLDPVYEAVSY